MTKDECLMAISAAFSGADVMSSSGSWSFGVEDKANGFCSIILMPKFVESHIDSGKMTGNDLIEILKNAPSQAWDRPEGKVPMLVLSGINENSHHST